MILDNYLRPLELFDPSNKVHRQHYANFLIHGTWGKCPIRFGVEDDMLNNNLAAAMQRMLVEYYMEKEVDGVEQTVVQKPQNLVRQKRR